VAWQRRQPPDARSAGRRLAGAAVPRHRAVDSIALKVSGINIVFHGADGGSFGGGFAALLDGEHEIRLEPERPDPAAYAAADVIIGTWFDASLPRPRRLRLFHVAGAGTDAVDFAALPARVTVCNCFGHEQAISEYVMAALLARCVPFAEGDAALRRGLWPFAARGADTVHRELAGRTIGLLGYGRIGKAIAARARAFELRIHVANRSPVAAGDIFDRAWGLDRLGQFFASAEFIVASLPLTPDTAGLVDAAAFAAMRPDAVLINVGRGGVVDEAALYDALATRRIAGAIIDTWYQYPDAPGAPRLPSRLPFHELKNIVMTPHMSGWTAGTIRRRQQAMADNINRLVLGERLVNVVRAGKNES
jgi:phosphoglycerate dehydrogenase-like enzyme